MNVSDADRAKIVQNVLDLMISQSFEDAIERYVAGDESDPVEAEWQLKFRIARAIFADNTH